MSGLQGEFQSTFLICRGGGGGQIGDPCCVTVRGITVVSMAIK